MDQDEKGDTKIIDGDERSIDELEDLRQIFRMTLDMICIADLESTRFLKVNPAFTEILGYSEEELTSVSFLELIHPDDVRSTVDVVNDKLKQGRKVIHFRNRYRKKDGSYVWLNWTSHPVPEKNITYAVARDITKLHIMKQSLMVSEERFQSFMDSTDDLVFLKGSELEHLYVNDSYRNFLGKGSKEEIVGKDDFDLLPENLATQCRISDREALSKNEITIREEKSGDKYFESRKFPVRLENGEIGLGGIISDITASKLAEKRVLEEKKKAEFYLDLLGHDIGNLHQGLSTSLQMALMFPPDDNRHRESLEIANMVAKKSMILTDSIMVLSKIRTQKPDLKQVDVGSHMKEAIDQVKSLYPEKEVRFNYPPVSYKMMAEDLLKEAFFNLLHNGVKFQEGDRPEIDIEVTESSGGELIVDISDHGSGIPDKMKGQLFRRFEMKSKDTRMGLGLSLVKELVERYNGEIEVGDRIEGNPESGARFRMRFPLIMEDS